MTSGFKNNADSVSAIAVGIDGGPSSIAALEWALATDVSWGPVTPVAAWHLARWRKIAAGPATSMLAVGEELEIAAMIDAMTRDLSPEDQDRITEPLIIEGSPGGVLAAAGEHSGLLVVGTRSRGAVADTVLGSVSVDCAAQALGPVVVVPESAGVADGPVVVGIDGSSNSVEALRWAIDHYNTSVPIIALGSWTFLVHGAWQEFPVDNGLTEDDTRAIVEGVVAAVTAAAGVALGRVEVQIEKGDPRTALHLAAEKARMLVLGSTGVTGWKHALLGSVTTALLHQPAAPTAVIPARTTLE